MSSGVVSLSDAGVTTAKIANNAISIDKLPTGATSSTYLRGDGSWVNPAISSWSNTGNAGTVATNNYIGTSDNNELSIRTNNTEAVRVTTTYGNVGVGTATPKSKLDVNGYIKIGSSDNAGDTTPVAGMIRFNNITGKFQGYVNDNDSVTVGNQPGWVDLN